MTPDQVLDSVRDVAVVNHDKAALEISAHLRDLTKEQQRQAFAGSNLAGYFYLHRIDAHPDTVMECVVTQLDSITSTYKSNRIFQSAAELIATRERLVKALAEKVGLPPESVGIDDPGRGRTLGLDELSTGQLIDMLAEKAGRSIVTTDSHSVAGAGGINV